MNALHYLSVIKGGVLEALLLVAVIAVLVAVHEFGHFIVAKLSGMRVDEFGFGFPPRALTFWKKGDTEYTLNWLPFGGFVRIFGEQAVVSDTGEEIADPRAFTSKPRIIQALVLVAGVVMNLLIAYALIFASQLIGSQQLLEPGQEGAAKNVSVIFTDVLPNSPAAKAGFETGDLIKNTMIRYPTEGISYNGTNSAAVISLIGSDTALAPIEFTVDRNSKILTLTAIPQQHIVTNEPSRPAIGVAIQEIGITKTPLKDAPVLSAKIFWTMVTQTGVGLYSLLKGVVTFKPNLSEIAGPIGIAPIVGNAAANGFGVLLWYTALISINLAFVNLIPIPALDGGRLLFVIIEAIRRKKLNPKIADRVNMVGFVLLIALIIIVSVHDIFKLVH